MPTAAQLAEFQIKLNIREMTKLDGEILRMKRRGVSPDHLNYRRATERLKVVKEASRGWRQKYFNLTGRKWLHYEMPEWDISAQYRREQTAKDKAAYAKTKSNVRRQVSYAYSERIREVEQSLALLMSNVKSARSPLLQIPKNATNEQVVQKGFEEVGYGFTQNFMVLERLIPWDVEHELAPKIRKSLTAAKSAYQIEKHQERFLKTHRHLMKAATLINEGMAAMSRYQNAVQRNGKLAIAYIKWTSIVVTAGAGAGYTAANGAAVQGLQAVGVSMSQKTGEEGATLAARWAAGEKVTQKDVRKAIAEISLAGATSAAGEIASAFAGPVAAKIFGTPSKKQLEAVAGVLNNVVANNMEQAMKAISDSMNGKPVNWDFWASLVAPALPGTAGAAVKDKDIRRPVTNEK